MGYEDVEWHPCGILHKVGKELVQEIRTLQFEDHIRGSTCTSTCRMKDYTFKKANKNIGVRELDISTSGVGFKVWDAAIALCCWLYENRDSLQGKKVGIQIRVPEIARVGLYSQ